MLVVDDNELIVAVVKEYLSAMPGHYSVQSSADYAKGLSAILRREHDVYLVDLNLRGKDGVALIREAKKSGCVGPYICLTSEEAHEYDLAAMNSGATDYLFKGSLTPTLLERAVRYAVERTRTLQALSESEERYALATRGTSDGIWDWKLRANTIYLSPRWKQMLGIDENEELSDPEDWFSRVHPSDLDNLKSKIQDHCDGVSDHFECEYRILHAEGQYRWILCRGMALWDDQGAYRIAGSQADVTRRATYDALTGIPNRTLFRARLEQALARTHRFEKHRFAVLFLDLDRFKLINDSLGHVAGDQLLVDIAQRLGAMIRAVDTFARLGGDEFAILIEGFGGNFDVIRVAETIKQRLAEPFVIQGREIFTTGSIGITLSETGYESIDDILRDADTAMYCSKSAGRNQYTLFENEMHEQARRVLELEGRLRRAVEAETIEIALQPIVDPEGQLVSFEALARWMDPETGRQVGPDEFIPLAEDAGLIVVLDRIVLKKACGALRRWRDAYGDDCIQYISVNLSRRQFSAPDLVEVVLGTLDDHRLSGSDLVIEVTEHSLLNDLPLAQSIFQRFRDNGVRIALDDFGVGYSSIKNLLELQFDALKIDRSFTAQIESSSKNRQLARAIILIGRELELAVVAEGVETETQVNILSDMGGQLLQGYYFGKPMLLARATEWIHERLKAKDTI